MSGIIGGAASKSGIINPTVGHLISNRVWKDTSGTYMVDAGPIMAIRDSISFTEISGNTYVITVNIYQNAENADGGSTNTRRWYSHLKYGANDSQGDDVTSNGTVLFSANFGRYLSSATGTGAYGYSAVTLQGSYVAGSSGTQYFTIASNTDGSTIDCTSFFNAANPAYYTVAEYYGNSLTAIT